LSQVYSGISQYFKRLIAQEISASVRYYDSVHLLERADQPGYKELLSAIDAPVKNFSKTAGDLRAHTFEANRRVGVVLDGNLNHSYDIEGDLAELRKNVGRNTRIFAVVYNTHLSPLYRLFKTLGLRKAPIPTTFLTVSSLSAVADLSGFRVVRIRNACFFPFRLLGIGDFINRWVPAIPLLKWATFCSVVVFQPKHIAEEPLENPSLSIVVPARNERGNIEPLFGRLDDLKAKIELIFVEGHSSDGTWEEIQRCQKLYGGRFSIQSFQQTGKGKADAVRLGFANARCDLLTILDADLTMPPELLGRFYEAYRRGDGDFINGNRLVYPMEGEAMRFLNWLGNLFFAKSMSFVLDTYLGDTLCGTKLITRHDYARATRWRADFGDFDPFGDFELLFPACILGLGVVDIPIRYRARTYGSTNIARFRHGLMLLKMVLVGLVRVKA
jgi:hypothetical protein